MEPFTSPALQCNFSVRVVCAAILDPNQSTQVIEENQSTALIHGFINYGFINHEFINSGLGAKFDCIYSRPSITLRLFTNLMLTMLLKRGLE